MSVMRFNETTGLFDEKGGPKSADIAVGVAGQVLVKDWLNETLYELKDNKWVIFDKEKVLSFAIGRAGRVFKRTEENRLLMQVSSIRTESILR